jgi:3-deoxy-D-manno-octulosonic-acid transferase
MMVLLDLAYLVGLVLALPTLVLKSLRTGKYRSGWAGRFGRGELVLPRRAEGTRVLLLHCVSVGELLSVKTLIERLLAADASLHVVVSTGTDTGTARAAILYPPSPNARVHAVRFPLDFSFAVEEFFERARPDAIALAELEIWPNFLAIAQSRRVPVVVINGRISERSFPRYRRIGWLMERMLAKVAWIGAQTETIRERFVALGAKPTHVEVIPTLKYDNAAMGVAVPGKEALAAAMGLGEGHRLFVAGSTGPGEEEPVLDAYMALKEKYPGLRLAIVPRHPEVVAQVVQATARRGLKPVLRTQRPDGSGGGGALSADEVFILNTMGELRKLYALAFAVFVGRSLVKLGGSDMIEVAAMGKPCCFGPFTANFAEAVELLVSEQAGVVVQDGSELTGVLDGWLKEPAGAEAMGERGMAAVARQRGSTERYVAKLLEVVRKGRA